MTEPEIIGDSGVVDQFLVDLGIKDQAVPDKAKGDTTNPDKNLIADMLKDGIGPKADASDASTPSKAATVEFYKGTYKKGNPFTICKKFKPDNLPSITLWRQSTSSTLGKYWTVSNSYSFLKFMENSGCLELEGNASTDTIFQLRLVY